VVDCEALDAFYRAHEGEETCRGRETDDNEWSFWEKRGIGNTYFGRGKEHVR
jgi:hypothetical protein